MTQRIHTIIGAGQVGGKLATHLLENGHHVRVIRRSAAAATHERLETRQVDVSNVEATIDAVAGSSVVYHCANPSYDRWHTELLPMTASIIAAASAASARLVVLDNLYMYGAPAEPMTETTPMRPQSKKGELRAKVATELLAAGARGLELAIVRASDFFGPDTPQSAIFHPRTMERLAAGKPVELLGDPDMAHSYTFVWDVVFTLAALGEATRIDVDGDNPVWHAPTTWHGSSRELLELLAARHGTALRIREIPRWLLAIIGLVVPLVREVREMIYQWETPFILDDSRVRRVFGIEPTPIETAVAMTIGSEGLRAAPSPATMTG